MASYTKKELNLKLTVRSALVGVNSFKNYKHNMLALLELIRQLVSLKSRNPNLKVMAAVGGADSSLLSDWSSLAGSLSIRDNFAANVLTFLQNNNLDGIGMIFKRDLKFNSHILTSFTTQTSTGSILLLKTS